PRLHPPPALFPYTTLFRSSGRLLDASGRLFEALNIADLAQGSTVWLAVTGLSRSGKTVFITSLVHNLLSSLHNTSRMPLLRVVGDRKSTRLNSSHVSISYA